MILWWNDNKPVGTNRMPGWLRCLVVVLWQLQEESVDSDWQKIGVVKNVYGVVCAEKPIRGWCTGTVHETVTTFLNFLDLSFSKVPVLMVGFAAEILDGIHA